MRLGPVALTFAGVVKLEDIDESKHTARVSAQGTDAKGRGGAQAASVFRLEPAGDGSKVLVHTSLKSLGGGGAIRPGRRHHPGDCHAADESICQVPERQTRTHARGGIGCSPCFTSVAVCTRCIAASIPCGTRLTAKPIAGFALLAKVAWSWIVGLFRRS